MPKEITSQRQIIAKVIYSHEWRDGLSFFSDNNDYVQVGTWKYNGGKELLPHIHNEVSREVQRTQEVIYVRKGKLRAKIFTLDGKRVEEFDVAAGDTVILLNCGHGYDILEDGTEVLEVKNGPYLGAEVDRRRI